MRVEPQPASPPSTRGMSGNERVLKVLPLLTTPDEANRGHSEATLAGPFSPWEKVRMRVRAHPHRPRRRYECNQMQSNATELKVSPLLATPNEANQGRSEATLAGPFSPWEKVRMRVRAHPHRPRRR